ncbi:nicotinamide riboside transporter PnuC [Aquirufa rosea]|uniref:Nicotinamide riboside transporter PnuC n=1 Tax=Aquirufa rosea TaxID=2509241 RepID=A0A4Q1BZR5_9BACT|nr:nicotinamide riboside transporter PnuC [Aquirufa rosea]RXK49652.1 hypothetical protein ESB04_05615 [Aquirufa rosea]
MIFSWIVENIWEFSGILCSLLGVHFSIQKSVFAWLWNMIASILFGILFYQHGLYSDMELQVFFVLLAIYGFYRWQKEELDWQAEKSSKRTLIIGTSCSIIYGIFMGYFHTQWTLGVSFAYLDATLTGLSIFGTWLAINRKIENWKLWIMIDFIYVIMYLQKELWGTSLLYFLYIFLAFRGLLQWKKNLQT